MTGNRTNLVVTLGMLAGVLLGGVLGYIVPEFMLAIGFLGKLFINALIILVLPMILVAVVSASASFAETRRLGRAGSRIIAYFAITTAISAGIGLILALVLSPGKGVNVSGSTAPILLQAPHASSVGDFIASLLPDNLIRSLTDGYYLGIVLLALALGAALGRTSSRGRTVIFVCRELMESLGRIVQYVQYVAPIGVFSLVGSAVALNMRIAGESVAGAGSFTSAMIVGLLVQGVIVLPLILKLWGKRKVVPFGSGLMPAFLTAFGTGSTAATLPITYECAVNRNRVDNRTSSLVLPLGAVANMNVTALYIVLATFFVAQAFNLSLSFGQLLMLGISAVVLSLGTPGIPSGGFFLLLIAFGVAGLPPSAYAGLGLLMAVDWIIDRLRAVVNVWGDSIGAAVVAQSIGRGYQEPGTSESGKPGREFKRGRPEPGGHRADTWRQSKQERTSAVESMSPFAVTSAGETDLETPAVETSHQTPETDRSGEFKHSRDDQQGDRSGRFRQRSHDRRDQSGRSERGERSDRSDRSDRGERGRRHEGRGDRDGGRRFGERGRGDRGGHHPRRERRGEHPVHAPETNLPDTEPTETVHDTAEQSELAFREQDSRTSSEFTDHAFRSSRATEDETPFGGNATSGSESDMSESPSSESESETKSMEYGRNRVRRVEMTSGDDESGEESGVAEPPLIEAPSDDPANSEPIEFGRTPRKRLSK